MGEVVAPAALPEAFAGPSPREETDSPYLEVAEPESTYDFPPGAHVDERARLLEGPPPRTIARRYADALGGSWAGTGLMTVTVGITGGILGLAIGCPLGGGLGCTVGAVYGLMGGAALGWLLGPGIGTARGAGLDPAEAMAPWALGVLSNGAVVAIAAAAGAGIDGARGSGNSGLSWGVATGTMLGALVQVFLTPLFAVLIFDDRPEPSPSIEPRPAEPTLTPLAAPTDGGFTAGLGGAF